MYLLNKSKKVMLAAICSTSIFGITALAENDLVSNSSFNDALNNWQIEGILRLLVLATHGDTTTHQV